MRTTRILPVATAVWLVLVWGPACEGPVPDEAADADTDADTDTDTDTDTSPAPWALEPTQTQEDVPAWGEGEGLEFHSLETLGYASLDADGAGSFEGFTNVMEVVDDELRCDTDVWLTGTPFTGDCVDCEFAFEIEGTILEERGTDDCWLYPSRSFVPIDDYERFYLAYAESYVVYGYGLHDVLMVGVGFRWFDTSYPGPYWYSALASAENSASSAFDREGDDINWSLSESWATGNTNDLNGYNGCFGEESSDRRRHQGDTTLTSSLDCNEVQVDVFSFEGAQGVTLSISVDTVAADSAFDPMFWVNDPDGCSVLKADDSFDCTYEPLDYQCPSGKVELSEGTWEIHVVGWGSCTGQTADYELLLGVEE